MSVGSGTGSTNTVLEGGRNKADRKNEGRPTVLIGKGLSTMRKGKIRTQNTTNSKVRLVLRQIRVQIQEIQIHAQIVLYMLSIFPKRRRVKLSAYFWAGDYGLEVAGDAVFFRTLFHTPRNVHRDCTTISKLRKINYVLMFGRPSVLNFLPRDGPPPVWRHPRLSSIYVGVTPPVVAQQ